MRRWLLAWIGAAGWSGRPPRVQKHRWKSAPPRFRVLFTYGRGGELARAAVAVAVVISSASFLSVHLLPTVRGPCGAARGRES